MWSQAINCGVCSIHGTYTVGKTQSLEAIHHLLKRTRQTLVSNMDRGEVINACVTETYDREAYLEGFEQIDCLRQ